jgi:TolA-binding protein
VSGKSAQGDLLLEEGFVRAAQGDKRAAESLQTFIRQFPQSPRVAEAWVALAELAFHAAPPDLKAARKDLERARQSPSNAAATERAAYLAIWMEDAAQPSDPARVIALANHFLQQHPDSAFSAEVRMKLAEAHFRHEDFANAQTQFELLAQKNPTDPFVEKALFFAAESAMSSMGVQSLDRALALLTQVVAMNGEMKWAARNEQALVERKLGKDHDALLLYDEVLKNNARPAEKREALCGKGDIYYEMAANDPEKYKRALELFEQLAAEPGVSAHWRNQALFKKGKCLEKLNDTNGALATYYSVIEEGVRPDLHEFFWFYKAGFNAAHLLEEQKKWQPAAAVYQKLAAVSGTRSDEAKARLTQLRLEHFLWEE